MITKDKWNKLHEKMKALLIHETELVEKFIIGSGKGGQKLHKTASVVYLKHLPSGLEIKCQVSRSREDNRYFARLGLYEKLLAILSDEKSKKQQENEKKKRQKKRRTRRAKERMMDDKNIVSTRKTLRKKPIID